MNEWQRRNCAAFLRNHNEALTSGYWRGFASRYGHIITGKKGVKFDHKRAEWSTFQNFNDMYNSIYEQISHGGIANEREMAVKLNQEGKVVERPDEALGLETKYKIVCPDKL